MSKFYLLNEQESFILHYALTKVVRGDLQSPVKAIEDISATQIAFYNKIIDSELEMLYLSLRAWTD